MDYNLNLISTLFTRFEGITQAFSYPDYVKDKDIYRMIASRMYNIPYEDLCNNSEYATNMRNLAKAFIMPVVAECGGITTEDTE